MTQPELAGEHDGRNIAGGRTIVVGVKLDSESRELLTWALVKAAHPVDHDGKSSLLSLVKAFDSILAVYDGFCNLKQVDLKLKICRGGSIRKIIVREAKSSGANEVIVGTATTHHAIRSSSSVAKYCARKLSKNYSIVAVNNGKIVFHRDSPSSPSNVGAKDHHKNRFLSVIHRSFCTSPKLLKNENEGNKCNQFGCKKLELANGLKYNCSICSPDSVNPTAACILDENGDHNDGNRMALVPVQKKLLEASKSLPELKPGWPLLRRAISSKRLSSDQSPVRQISVVEWAMRLPVRNQLLITNYSSDETIDNKIDRSLNDEDEAIVVHGDENQFESSSSSNSDAISLPEELEGLHERYSSSCRLFKFEELATSTANFKPENIIGEGGNSHVYRACLPDGREVAVKISKASEDVLKEFVLEIEIITALHHQNIISLFGFCFEDNKLLLVYDLLSRGSLEDNLHGGDNTKFGWCERYKVAVGVAEALVYLHSKCEKPVIHRDVKSSNILLSDDFEPQLSDFGLAKWATPTGLHITCTDVAGTFGYLAPEYFTHGKVTEKIDVYAFGVVLLELLTGRKPISNEYPKGEQSLVIWAKPILNSGKFARLLDPGMGDDYDADQIERMALASTLCIRRAPRARPHMGTILKLLQGDVEVTKWARLELDSSDGSDTRLHISNIPEETEGLEDEGFSLQSNLIWSHLNLALLDIEDSSLSMSSIEENVSLEEYLRGRWSRSSSFD
ncbi:protein kinase STUNTED-like isoform X2 [Rutidosis leptorrhynchoides]|uniref:protein kinase STUNTED-like isoform X2 n=1 Tax=Rutidosis leptorrhynchoides TaxID=125765 RepID=UPI003A995C3A